MRNRFTLLVGIIVAGILLAYMFAFQVRYDEVAVRTTFKEAGPDSKISEPGLYARWPWPFQQVYTYDRQIHVLEDELEQLQTADGHNVIVRTYTAWRIREPLSFFRSLKTVKVAERQLLPIIRDTREVISEYDFDELINTEASRMRLEKAEKQALTHLRRQLKGHDYGIEVVSHGIRRVLLPQDVTEKVFQQMRKTRERLAANTRASGEAEAARIRSEARSLRERIMAFAKRRAQAIRAQGDKEAAAHYDAFEKNQAFAIFLREIEALEKMLKHNTTFVLDADELSPLELLEGMPDVSMPAPTTRPAQSGEEASAP